MKHDSNLLDINGGIQLFLNKLGKSSVDKNGNDKANGKHTTIENDCRGL